MYGESVAYYDKLYESKDYGNEAAKIIKYVKERNPTAQNLLDVACGTGKHIEHLAKVFKAEGVDISRQFVLMATERNPECKFHVGDMTRFNLKKKYDAITCLFSSIGYVRTIGNLNKAIKNMARHLARNGVIIVEPWFTPETWYPGTVHATFVDEPTLKIARISTSKAQGNLSIMEMHYIVGIPDCTRSFKELHQMGLFKKEEMIEAFRRANLKVQYEDQGITGRGVYIGLN